MISQNILIHIKRTASAIISLCLALTLVTSSLPESLRVHADGCNQSLDNCFEVYTPGLTEYTVHNVTSFNNFAALVNSGTDFSGVTINLTANIDALRAPLSAPAGTEEHPFNGTFNGNGNTISNVSFADSSFDYNGIFGYIGESGIVNSITADSCTFTGSGRFAGGIAGRCDGVLSDCSVNSVNIGATQYAGGICGYSDCGYSDCSSSGNVSVTGENGFAGGFAGYIGGSLLNCSSSCTVSGSSTSSCGGFAAQLVGKAENCYTIGAVSGGRLSGGLAGICDGGADNCYAAGTVTGGSGFAAKLSSPANYCYWNVTDNTTGVGEEKTGFLPTGKTTAELSSDDMTALLNARAIGIVNALAWEADTASVNGGFPVHADTVAGFGGGNGSAEAPYIISSAGHLRLFIELVNTNKSVYGSLCYKMTNDIVLDPQVSNNIETIGDWDGLNDEEAWGFNGTFDGGGYSISGIHINRPNIAEDGCFSLFACLEENACVKNLDIVNAKVISSFYCGLIASLNFGTIINCRVSGTTNPGSSVTAGGIAAVNHGTIANCISHANAGTDAFGGIVGDNYDTGTITNCFFDGNARNGGGICNSLSSTSATDTVKGNYFLQTDTINPDNYGIFHDYHLSGDTYSNVGAQPVSQEVASGTQTYGDTGKTLAELLNENARLDTSLLLWRNNEDGSLDFAYPQTTLDCSYGTIDVSPSRLAPGALITLRVRPEDNFVYKTNSLSVALSSGGTVALTRNHDESFSFIAPQTDITISADFVLPGSGTESAPFELYSAANIRCMAEHVNAGINSDAIYILKNSIRYSADDAEEFIPIGTALSGFEGKFIGNGCIISNIITSRSLSGGGYFGFFGCIDGGSVSGLSVNANITLIGSVGAVLVTGGIVAHLKSGTVDNCSFSGKITVAGGTSDSYGAIAGISGGSITNSSNSASLTATGNVGGIVGTAYGVIWNCYNRGSVSGALYGGGIAGKASASAIENCYNCATVSATNAGGIAALTEASSLFSNCVYSLTLFDGKGIAGTDSPSDEITSMTTDGIKSKSFADTLNTAANTPLLDRVSALSVTAAQWMQNSATSAGCPSFLRQAVNVVKNSVTNADYWDIRTAIDEASGARLILLQSLTPSYPLTFAASENVRIDLNQKTLTCTINNSGTLALSNGTAVCDITCGGALTLTDTVVSGSGSVTVSGTLTLGGSTQITASGGIVLESGFVGVSSALSSANVAMLSSDDFSTGYQAVKGTGFALTSEYADKFTVSGEYSLGYYKNANALQIMTAPEIAVTQAAPAEYDAAAIAAGSDFTVSTLSRGVISYSYCAGTQYNASTAWTQGLPVNAGSYVIRATVSEDTENGLSAVSGYGVVEISKKALTVTAENKSISYLANPPAFSAKISGFAGNDTSSVISGSVSYTCEYTNGNPIGSYDIIPDVSGLSAANYYFSAVNGALNVSDLILLVTFNDHNGSMIDIRDVAYGTTVSAPDAPARNGYTFTGWDKPLENITENTTLTAQYVLNTYTVKFLDYDGTVLDTQTVEHGENAALPSQPSRENHSFWRWDKSLENITADTEITAQYRINTYSVKFLDHNGSVLNTQTIEHGQNAEIPANPLRTGYTFIGWDKSLENITADTEITALYEINSYTVLFLDYDGTTLSTQTVEHGKNATSPNNPAREGYTFTGWNKSLKNITADTEITAQYSVKTYLVVFRNEEGMLFSTQNVRHGGDAIPPDVPVIEGYTFTRWDTSYKNITADVIITAEYSPTVYTYTVSFLDYDGTVLDTQSIEHGKNAVAPTSPEREGYTFAGWDKSLENITAITTITAQYQITVYTVSFLDYDGTVLDTQSIEHGKNAVAPTSPAREGYTFTGWDKSLENITEITTITAQYQIKSYTVSFLDYDGTVLDTQSIEHGKNAVAPTSPEREGYTFTGWDKSLESITADTTITAQYQIKSYTVSFLDYDGTVLDTQSIEHGKNAVAPTSPEREGYTFTGWDKSLESITADTTITAQYTPIQVTFYTVSFLDYDGTVLDTQSIEHGKNAVAPTSPEREGYTFTGWDKSLESITADTTITAQYQIKSYTVNFLDYDGTVLDTQSIEHGKNAVVPTEPVREGYTFTGWDKSLENITADITITAQYTPIQVTFYTVSFLDYDGTVLDTQSIEHGKSAVAPSSPEREGYTFTGWSADFSKITEAINIVAQYSINTYAVRFFDYDNTLISEQSIEHGRMAVAPSDPQRTGYTFTGWDEDFSAITHELIVTAEYVINIYTVIFADYNGEILSETQVEYGTDAEPPETPQRDGYSFVDWNRSYTNVAADITVTAVYEIIPDKITYTVTFVDYDDTELYVCEVEYWGAATAPDEPSRSGYTFIGWDKDFTAVNENITVRALYEENISSASFTVIFRDFNGTTIEVQNVESGSAAVAPADPERYGYIFIGWDKDFSCVESYLTVTAQYELSSEKVQFTVIFNNYDGSLLSKEIVEYMGSAEAPEVPERTGYEFTGWDKKYTEITDNITITAQYQLIKFLVVFFDYDGALLDQQLISYGNTAIYPEEPVRNGYTFIGWDTDFSNVTEELAITALYEIKTYPVTFCDYDASVLSVQQIEHGGSATAPSEPKREGYTFTGWDKSLENITANTVITAQYVEIQTTVYTVSFLDYDGTVLDTQSVEHGKSATPPTAPAREGYTFAGWDKSFKSVISDMVITAQYKKESEGKSYTVQFLGMDKSVLAIRYVAEGTAAEPPEAPVIEGYVFTGWDKDYSSVTSDLTISALYMLAQSDISYTVVFLDYDDTVLDTQSIKSGESATAPEVPEHNGYTFSGWDKEFSEITSDLTVKAKFTQIFYSVSFMGHDGSIIDEQLVAYGAAAEAPEAPVRDGYVFKGWDVSFSFITQDTEVNAVYSMQITGSYTVTFVGINGTILKTEYVLDGDTAIAPVPEAVNGYTFIGWDTPFDTIFSDLTVTAIYIPVKYTVTFCDYNGNIISVQSVDYGKAATAPQSPVRTGYSFTGWDNTFAAVTGDITVTAVYKIIIYNVVFIDINGKILSIQQIEHGKAANPPDAPTVDGMTFVGWDTSFKSVTANLTIAAVYSEITTSKRTVVFCDSDGTIISVQYIEYGNDAQAPEAPQHEGYEFIGWDKGFLGVTQNLKVTALYKVLDLPIYTVNFKDWNGKILSTQSIKQGMSATSPSTPQRTGYTFNGWSASFSEITENITITALYTINTYIVTFTAADGTIIGVQTIEYNNAATAPSAPEREGHTFSGWSAPFTRVTADITVTALYSVNVYTVTFIGFYGEVLKKQQVSYLRDAVAPVAPKIKDYDFIRWSGNFTEVTESISVTAVYERSKLSVIFYDYDGSIISQQQVEYGESAMTPETPQRDGYTFVGWDMDFTNVKNNLIITAEYTIKFFTVRFLDWDGTVLYNKEVKYLGVVRAPSSPTRKGYTFMGWDSTFDTITADIDITALYSPLVLTVQFTDFSGNVFNTQSVVYSESAEAPEAPEVTGYTFTGWDTDFSCVTNNITVNAVYEKSVFTVTFTDWNGDVISTQEVGYKQEAAEPQSPQREGYTFSGWDKEFTSITSDITITALYTINTFAVKFYGQDNKLLSTVYAEYGQPALPPEAPELDGYVFSGWSESTDSITAPMSVYALYTELKPALISIPDTDAILDEMVCVPLMAELPQSFSAMKLRLRWNTQSLILMRWKSAFPCETEYTEDGMIISVTPVEPYSGSCEVGWLYFFVTDIFEPEMLQKLSIDIEIIELTDANGNSLKAEVSSGRILPDRISLSQGDLSLNGKLEPYDALMILRWCAEMITLNEIQLYLADINGDGEITPADAMMILSAIAEE